MTASCGDRRHHETEQQEAAGANEGGVWRVAAGGMFSSRMALRVPEQAIKDADARLLVAAPSFRRSIGALC